MQVYRITIVNMSNPDDPTIMPSELIMAETRDVARDLAIYTAAVAGLTPSMIKIAVEAVPFC